MMINFITRTTVQVADEEIDEKVDLKSMQRPFSPDRAFSGKRKVFFL